MELLKGFLYSKTLQKSLMSHAQLCFSILGGQLPVTCEHCNICIVTGEGTSFWNVARHSFTIHSILALFLREVPIRTYVLSNIINLRIIRQKVHFHNSLFLYFL